MSEDKKKDLFDQAKKQPEELQLELDKEQLEQMILEKSKENLKLQELLNSTKQELVDVKVRALNVHEKNKLYEADPSLAAEMARMEYHMNLAKRFVAAGAFKVKNAEEAYVKIKAGAEMGLKPIESMQALYIVNGSIRYYGDKMLAKITKHGYKIQYLEETEKSVKVRIFHPVEEKNFDEFEIVLDTDQIIQNSKAKNFSKKNKMRFHGIRMIASFHLPHLFSSTEDEFTTDFREFEEGNKVLLPEGKKESSKARIRVLEHIKTAKEKLDLNHLKKVEGHKAEFDVVEEYDEALNHILSNQKKSTNEK